MYLESGLSSGKKKSEQKRGAKKNLSRLGKTGMALGQTSPAPKLLADARSCTYTKHPPSKSTPCHGGKPAWAKPPGQDYASYTQQKTTGSR